MADKRLKLLLDAIQAIELCMAFMDGQSLEAYSGNPMRRSAVERQLEILGEALVRLGRQEPTLGERLPMARFAVELRNRIIHGYDGIDDAIVHATVHTDLPEFLARLQAWLAELDTRA
jgi:uncharacterized protein with HEPN domain